MKTLSRFYALASLISGLLASNDKKYTCKEAYSLLAVDEALATRLWSRESARAKAGVRASVASDGNGPCPYAQAVYGVLLARGQKLDQALSYLTAGVQENSGDWVAASYLGALSELLARRISARAKGNLDSTPTALAAYRKALQASIQHLSAAANVMFDSSLQLPHAVLAQKPTYVYRSLGNALLWMNRTDEARALHRRAVQQKIGWVSEWARPADALPVVLPFPQPFFEENRTAGAVSREGVAVGAGILPVPEPLVQLLRTFTQALPQIRKEFLALMHSSHTIPGASEEPKGPGGTGSASAPVDATTPAQASRDAQSLPPLFKAEEAGLQAVVAGQQRVADGESWGVYVLKVDGTSRRDACQRTPMTCLTLQHPLTAVASGQAKFSVMLPGTHVRPHAGPTNGRLRMHCTLTVMHGGPASATFRVGNVSRHWYAQAAGAEHAPGQDECFLFDESFEHEVTTWTVQQVEAARVLEQDGPRPPAGGEPVRSTAHDRAHSPPVDTLGSPLHGPYRAVLLADVINPFVSTPALLESVTHPLAWMESQAGLLQVQQECREAVGAWAQAKEESQDTKTEL